MVDALERAPDAGATHARGATAERAAALAETIMVKKEHSALLRDAGGVLVVDDVVTYGATFEACAIKLRESYPQLRVYGAALAYTETPERGAPGRSASVEHWASEHQGGAPPGRQFPSSPSAEGALDVARVERNIDMAHSSRDQRPSRGRQGRLRDGRRPAARQSRSRQAAVGPGARRPTHLRRAETGTRAAPTAESRDEVSDEEVAQARARPGNRRNLEDLASIILVESIKGFGPQKFKELYDAGVSPGEVAQQPSILPTARKARRRIP